MYGTATLSLLMIITRDEKRELLRTRDRVAAEVFEVLHLVLREVPALVSYRREILVDGSRGFLLFVEAANIYFISFFWDSCPPTHISIPGYLRHSVISRYRRFHTEIPVARKIVDGPPILPTNFVGAQCCCQLALGVKWERFLTRRNIGRARSSS